MDFLGASIELRAGMDNWGPYKFLFPQATSAGNDGTLPQGDNIQSAVVKAYVGEIIPTSDLTAVVDISSYVVDEDYTIQTSTDYVLCKFKYPGIGYKGASMTLAFELTLASGAKNTYYFFPVKIA